jgi:hypothetical protein
VTLPYSSQCLGVIALAFLLVAFGLFVAPAPTHLLVWPDEDDGNLQRFVTLAVEIGLLPFAAALAVDIYITTACIASSIVAAVISTATFACAVFFWYGLEFVHRRTAGHQHRSRARNESMSNEKRKRPDIEDKIQHALTDARVVLPGAQALLGFQLVGVLLGGFEAMPASSKYVHVVSLTMVTLSTILLMMPAAYHRLVERGQPSEHFYRLTRNAVLWSMVPLAAGICGDYFVVVRKVSGSLRLANSATILVAALFFFFWFGLALLKRGGSKTRVQFG